MDSKNITYKTRSYLVTLKSGSVLEITKKCLIKDSEQKVIPKLDCKRTTTDE